MENKYSLLVVDDEAIARKHIVTLLDWEKLGIGRLYEAGNGYDAEEIIRRDKPDVMLLDIRMPEMSGTELMDRIVDIESDLQVIVLSAYSDFEVARKMLSTGRVAGYLLKPVEDDVLTEMIVKCTENIDEKRSAQQLKENYKEAQERLRKRAIEDLILGSDRDNAIEMLPNTSVKMQIGVCYVAENREKFDLLIADYAGIAPLKYTFTSNNPNFSVLYFESDDTVENAAKICASLSSSGYNIGLGRVYSDRQDINMSFQEAMIACEISLFSNGGVKYIEEIEKSEARLSGWSEYIEKLKAELRSGDVEAIDASLSEIFYSVLQKSVSEFSTERDNNLAHLKARTAILIENVLEDSGQNLNLSNVLSAPDSYSVYLACRSILLQKDAEKNSNISHKETVVEKAKKYIAENYAGRITLNSVAATVFVNPSYLSRLFSETEGCVFMDYVTKIRIKNAERILVNETDLKVYEVAEAVGYNSPKYFIKVFKEKTGMTPADYRSKHYFDARL